VKQEKKQELMRNKRQQINDKNQGNGKERGRKELESTLVSKERNDFISLQLKVKG